MIVMMMSKTMTMMMTTRLVPRVSLLCLNCRSEKRDPGNKIDDDDVEDEDEEDDDGNFIS